LNLLSITSRFILIYKLIELLLLLSFFSHGALPSGNYTLSLHDALPICTRSRRLWGSNWSSWRASRPPATPTRPDTWPASWKRRRSEEHTSELQSLRHLVCRLLLEKKKKLI